MWEKNRRLRVQITGLSRLWVHVSVSRFVPAADERICSNFRAWSANPSTLLIGPGKIVKIRTSWLHSPWLASPAKFYRPDDSRRDVISRTLTPRASNHTTSKMAFALSASTSKFVGAKVAVKPTVARRQARYVGHPSYYFFFGFFFGSSVIAGVT